jgi:hypothetical protein
MKRLIAAVLAATGLLVMGCSPDEGDFQQRAEEFVSDQIFEELDLDSEVTCEAPASTDVGTTFTCSAKAADGTRYEYLAEITGDNGLTVTLAR